MMQNKQGRSRTGSHLISGSAQGSVSQKSSSGIAVEEIDDEEKKVPLMKRKAK